MEAKLTTDEIAFRVAEIIQKSANLDREFFTNAAEGMPGKLDQTVVSEFRRRYLQIEDLITINERASVAYEIRRWLQQGETADEVLEDLLDAELTSEYAKTSTFGRACQEARQEAIRYWLRVILGV